MNVVGTLDPRPALNGKPPGYKLHRIDSVGTSRTRSRSGNDRECLMRDIVHYTHQTLGRFAPAWNTARKRKSEIRIVLGAATRTGMGKIDDEGAGPNHRNGYRAEIEFMMGSFRKWQHRTEGKRYQQRLRTISAHLPLSDFHIRYRPRVRSTEPLDTGKLIDRSGD